MAELIGRPVVGGGQKATTLFLGQVPYPAPKSEESGGGNTSRDDMLAAAGHGRPGSPGEVTPAVAKAVAADRFVRCYRVASQLGHPGIEVHVRAYDARQLFRSEGNWCCKEQCGFGCFE